MAWYLNEDILVMDDDNEVWSMNEKKTRKKEQENERKWRLYLPGKMVGKGKLI